MIVQIEVLGWPTDVAGRPALGNVDEQHIKLSAASLEALDRSHQAVCQHDVRRRGGLKLSIKFCVELDVAAPTSPSHVQAEDAVKARPLGKVILTLSRLV
ncbi:MAG: hypothetical protein ACRDSN_20680, partial [Pseudonocardiaceae bacterium]